MDRQVDQADTGAAALVDAAALLRDLALTNPEAFDKLRQMWPEMAQRVYDIVELVDFGR